MASNIVGQVVDQYGDDEFLTSPTALDLTRRGVIPDPTQLHKLRDPQFALKIAGRREHRFFPVDTPGSALLSAHYWEKADMLSPQARKTAGVMLKRAFVRFDLDMPAALKAVEDDASVQFPTVVEVVAEPKVAADVEPEAPLDALGAVVTAFGAQYAEMAPAQRSRHATQIAKTAAIVPGGLDILSSALLDYVERPRMHPDIQLRLGTRAKVAGTEAAAVAYGAIAASAATADPKVVIAQIEATDRETGVDLLYGQPGVADPYKTVYAGQPLKEALDKQKAVADDVWAQQTSKKAWNMLRLANRPDVLRGHLGETFTANFSRTPFRVYKDATVDQRKILDDLLDGIDPNAEIPDAFVNSIKSRMNTSRFLRSDAGRATVSPEADMKNEVGAP